MRFLPLLLLALVACSPAIGDSCGSSADCSVNGDRICDLAYPGGYCTVGGCDSDTCPDGAICVEWRFTPDRTAATFCMKKCGGDGGCRNDQYACMGDDDPRLVDPETGSSIARVIDLDVDESNPPNYCVAVEADPLTL
ncbi:MAG: hypothetical protein AAF411_18290 [Myxococcota bacterium]